MVRRISSSPDASSSFPARQQLVEQHPERVDVAAGVDVESAHLGLLWTNVGGRAHELLEGGEERLVGQALVGRGLGDAEVDDLGHRHAIVQSDQNV